MNQRGIALLVGVVLLAAVSLLAVLVASGTLLQRNMATNFREHALALENATIASAFASAWLLSRSPGERDPDCLSECLLPMGIYGAGELPHSPEFEGAGWWDTYGYSAGYDPEAAIQADDPDLDGRSAHWLIEEIHHYKAAEASGENVSTATGYYRILGRGQGKNTSSVAVIESILARPWGGEFEIGSYPPDGPAHSFCQQFEPEQSCGVLSWRQRR